MAFAFGVSLTLSIVSEPWSRNQRLAKERILVGYGAVSVTIGSVVSIGAMVVVLSMNASVLVVAMAGLAVFTTTVRSAMRYLQVHHGWWRRIVVAEALNLTAFLLVLAIGMLVKLDQLEVLCTAWGTAGLLSLLAGWPLERHDFGSLTKWFRRQWVEIKPLLRDSVLMDVGSIFAPLLLISPLGVHGFGTYRAVSNVAAPVRLLLNPLRAVIGKGNVSLRDLRDRRAIILLSVGIFSGVAASLALMLVGWLGLEVGVLASLTEHAVAVGIFVSGNFLGHYAYIRCRHTGTGRRLLVNRLIQTGLMLLLPLLGAFVGGLGAAIWGLSLATVISGAAWILSDRPGAVGE
ncbi:hypothetical protein ABDK96_08430 [Citricoccus nitrophenolicus]|uniref:Polysaccharide biosynthesis protein n=1 Tax=Citricoccus nitrophenolicus TaxID=863575 RepID=A0ABV0II93_9MICC